MNDHPDTPVDPQREIAPDASRESARRVGAQLAIEVGIGLGVAALIVIVAWASSNAIRFVYGGY